jgi:O-antigen ligase
MVPTFTFVVVAFVILSAGDLRWTQRSMIVAALLVLPTWVVAWIGLEFPLPRASDPVVPLAVLVLLYWTGTQERWFRGVAIASVLGLLSYLAMTTSRMGSAVTLMVVLIWIWTSSRWSVMIKALTSTALVAASTLFWFGGAWGRERLLGRDATIGIGPIRINGEGRVEAANLALGPMPSPASSLGFWQVVAGNGGGTSGQRLVDAGFILDKPHNEFLRAFVDGGLILTAGLAAMICLPLVIGILNYRRTREKTLLLLPMSVSLILLSFSLTDNAMSYIWLMLPAGVLVSWSRSRAVNGSPVPTTRFADQPP